MYVLRLSVALPRIIRLAQLADLPVSSPSRRVPDWIIFIMLANMVMLNLVVGVVCAAMTEATDNHSKGSMRETCLQNIVDETQVPRKIVDTWAAVRACNDVDYQSTWLACACQVDPGVFRSYCAGLFEIR
jgi:hypothetical protein